MSDEKDEYIGEMSQIVDGMATLRLSSWQQFISYVNVDLVFCPKLLFRGQRDDSWPLISSLDRADIESRQVFTQFVRDRSATLQHFKDAARGRRGPRPEALDDGAWWALGQHYGLRTPLLDWTESPFVAAYFAFCAPQRPPSGYRAVFVLQQELIQKKSDELLESKVEGWDEDVIVQFISPSTEDNSRLIHQRSSFTMTPPSVSMEEWIGKHFKGNSVDLILCKVMIPDPETPTIAPPEGACVTPDDFTDRKMFLRALDRMNINDLTLFPDIQGACMHCNAREDIGFW